MSRLAPLVAVLLVVVLVGGLPVAARPRPPRDGAAFIVNSTDDREDERPGNGFCSTGVRIVHDDGGIELECTLRAAIQEANASSGADSIRFGILSSSADCDAQGVCTISPASALPTITQPLTINGYSQPGASVNTATTGTDAVLKIVLDGSRVDSAADGLVVTARNSTVKGLVINNGFHFGVVFDTETSSGAGRRLEGCFIGTDVSGTVASGNRGGVIVDDGEGNVVGGDSLAARNLISGNSDTGIFLSASATGNRVEGNLIGTKRDGTTALGNRTGIHVVGGSDNTIGGTRAAANTIAFNRFHGIQVQDLFDPGSGTGNSILSNSIHDNAELGIQLGADDVTANDLDDPDAGANRLQNFPTIESAVVARGSTTIKGKLNSTPNRTFTIQFFSSPEAQADPSGFGEGQTFLGKLEVETNGNGNASFAFVPNQPVPVGSVVTATATNNGGNTSEFSNARVVTRR